MMKKLLAAAALGAITLSAPAQAQSVPSALGGGLSEGAAVALGALVFVAIIAADDDDTTTTTTN